MNTTMANNFRRVTQYQRSALLTDLLVYDTMCSSPSLPFWESTSSNTKVTGFSIQDKDDRQFLHSSHSSFGFFFSQCCLPSFNGIRDVCCLLKGLAEIRVSEDRCCGQLVLQLLKGTLALWCPLKSAIPLGQLV